MYEIPSASHRFESMDASHDEKRNLSFSFLQARQVPAIVDPFALVVGWRAASCFAAAISVRENLSQNELQYPGFQPAFEVLSLCDHIHLKRRGGCSALPLPWGCNGVVSDMCTPRA